MRRWTILIALSLVLAGCQSRRFHWPELHPRSPEAERASFTQNDPLPDSSLGPSVSGRPREATIQRGEPRRTLEAAMPSMIQNGDPSIMQSAPNSYPDVVMP